MAIAPASIVPSVARSARGRSAQNCADAASELADREGLRDVVVGAELEPEHLVDLVVARRQHDDRDGGAGSEPAAHLEAVEAGQHHVEHHQVDGLLREPAQRLLAVARLDDRIALPLQRIGQELLDGLLVVDQHDGGFAGHDHEV